MRKGHSTGSAGTLQPRSVTCAPACTHPRSGVPGLWASLGAEMVTQTPVNAGSHLFKK